MVKTPVIFLVGMIVSMTTSQIMFKLAGNYSTAQHELLYSFLLNTWLWAGLLASGAGMACWLLTLRNMPLAIAYPWTALIYVLTPLCSVLVFKELLTVRYGIGMVFIVLGIFITTSGASKRK